MKAMDPGTGLAILGSAAGGAKIVEKILGPTAEYVGIGLKNWTERRIQNVARIFHKAAQKLGSDIDTPGIVPPRVLKEVLNEGSYSDDELTAEYFGGILASARSPNGRDDRAASYLRLTSELSTYQIRFHFTAYTLFRRVFLGSTLRPTFADDLGKMLLLLPYELLFVAMDFTSQEPGHDILVHCASGLGRHKLIDCVAWGKVEHLNTTGKKYVGADRWIDVTAPGMIVEPTHFGIEYYLWALGVGRASLPQFLNADLKLPSLPEVRIPDGAAKTSR